MTPGPALSLDGLTGRWRGCLDETELALAAARRCGHVVGLSAEELGAHSRALHEERAAVSRLLDEIAHDDHVALRHPLNAPRATNRMLGLPKGIRACVFDLDGVLVGSTHMHAAAWRDTLDALVVHLRDAAGGRHAVPYFDLHRDYYGLIHGRPRLEGLHAFLASRGVTLPEGAQADHPGVDTVHALANRKNELFQRRLAREPLDVLRGSSAYLEAAREAGLARAVVSPSANTGAILERGGLDTFVQRCVVGRTIERALAAACRELDVEPGDTAVFVTVPAGVAAAREAGIGYVVGVDRHGGATLRAAGADAVVADLAELLDPLLGD